MTTGHTHRYLEGRGREGRGRRKGEGGRVGREREKGKGGWRKVI